MPVEFELLENEIEKVDELIRFGQENYNWNSPGKILNYNTSKYKNIYMYYDARNKSKILYRMFVI